MNWRTVVGLALVAWGVMASLDDMMNLAFSLIPAALGGGLLAWGRMREE